VGVPLEPDTATVTPRLCAVVTLAVAGKTLTLAVAKACVTVTVAVPLELLYVVELAASGVYFAISVSEPTAREPAAIVMLADP
jgi:hypothetical protein